jgi:malate dehydrogenase (oxaloacetate-decarboxylating)
MPQSSGSNLTIRTEIAAQVGNFGRVMAAIGSAGAEIGGVEIVRSGPSSTTRDITVAVTNAEHGQAVVAALNALDGVSVERASDRVTLAHMGGTITMRSRSTLTNRDDLSMAYTPGVARVCMTIHDDPERTWDLTIRGNSIMVITDGSSVAGQGDLGPLAALPSAEAKCMYLREMAGIDGFPLPLTVRSTDEITHVVSKIVSVFAGVHMTDMAAPRCVEAQAALAATLDIPVLHDDQDGTAVAVLAGLINALGVAGKTLADATVVVAGREPAAAATARLLGAAGVGTLSLAGDDVRGALAGADAFVGLDAPSLSADDVASMATSPVVFALGTDPVVAPAGAAVFATARADKANQIDASLAYPGIWRGALDCRARRIDDGMLVAAAHAIAATAGTVAADNVVPSVLNPDLVPNVAKAVRQAAEASGSARLTSATV